MDILERLQNVFTDIFDDESIIVNEALNAEDIDDWDSLTHISLIEAVENEFGIMFSIDELAKTKNVGDMVAIIKSKID